MKCCDCSFLLNRYHYQSDNAPPRIILQNPIKTDSKLLKCHIRTHCTGAPPLLWHRVKQFNNLRKVIWENYSVSCPVIQIMYRIITISCKICLSCPWILHNQDPWNRFKMLMWRKVMDQVTLSFTELTSTTKVVVEALCVLSVILLLKANWNWQTGRQTNRQTDKPMYWEAAPPKNKNKFAVLRM